MYGLARVPYHSSDLRQESLVERFRDSSTRYGGSKGLVSVGALHLIHICLSSAGRTLRYHCKSCLHGCSSVVEERSTFKCAAIFYLQLFNGVLHTIQAHITTLGSGLPPTRSSTPALLLVSIAAVVVLIILGQGRGDVPTQNNPPSNAAIVVGFLCRRVIHILVKDLSRHCEKIVDVVC
jgi:hypothetical protein